MGKMRLMLGGLVLSNVLAAAACLPGGRQALPALETVSHVDLGRYMGVWYEIARYPNRFQEGCTGSRATYSLLNDGRVSVLNECYDGTSGGRLKSAQGKAWVVDAKTNARLKVSFFWIFAGDYWIIDLADDYSYAVVGHPKRTYLWILSRTKTMEDGTYQGIVRRLAEVHHYDTSRLLKTAQE